MDIMVVSALVLGLVALIAGAESRDGFDRDAPADCTSPRDARNS